jgi:paraquat-inducible protein A
MSIVTARTLRIVGCTQCGKVCRMDDVMGTDGHCPRCGATLHRRRPHSLMMSWALLVAAAVLYIPANLLPIMKTSTFFDGRSDTILSGVVVLWQEGAWDLAVIVFVASVMVPLLKIGVLAGLLLSVQLGARGRQMERARLFRMIERIGHWSMLDIFVVALLVALVNFQSYAQVQAGPGAAAFGGVVILTMLSAMCFDPRLIWDAGAPDAREMEPS